MSDIPRGTIFGRRVGNPPENDAEHFNHCPACDGSMDCRDLGEVFDRYRTLRKDQPQ